ncbi:hypothetical protein P4129_34205 [Pseudomonas aeruginosa]|nr:hypothetical protein [Pseudomonas aeruginosa]
MKPEQETPAQAAARRRAERQRAAEGYRSMPTRWSGSCASSSPRRVRDGTIELQLGV